MNIYLTILWVLYIIIAVVVAVFVVECRGAEVIGEHRSALLVHQRYEEAGEGIGLVCACRVVDERAPLPCGFLYCLGCRRVLLSCLRQLGDACCLKERPVGVHHYRVDIERDRIEASVHAACFERRCLEVREHLLRDRAVARKQDS